MQSGLVRDFASTLMFSEASEAGAAVGRLLSANAEVIKSLVRDLRKRPPSAVITCARGSSDNAATYGRYLIETQLGAVTGSLGLSVASIYGSPLRLSGGLCIAISQSGASPDLLASVEQARKAGAITVALINAEDSPLAAICDHVIALSAGPERSVAATKSFIASLCALAWLIAEWKGDCELIAAIKNLPEQLGQAWTFDWTAALSALQNAQNGFILGRGPGLGVAQEAALKLKETCGIHAEALSAAEVEHGPMALARPGFLTMTFGQDDASAARTEQVTQLMVDRGVKVISAGQEATGAINLPYLEAHAALQPILLIQSFYKLAAQVSVARGMNPDEPPHLQKVTRTI